MVKVNTSECELSDQDFEGSQLAAPGKALLQVTDISFVSGAAKTISIVLAHEKPGQVGKLTYNYFKLDGKGLKRTVLFAIACGVYSRQRWEQDKELVTPDIPVEKTKGCAYYGAIKKAKDSDFHKVEWDFHALDSPAADSYPKLPSSTDQPPAPEPPEEDISF